MKVPVFRGDLGTRNRSALSFPVAAPIVILKYCGAGPWIRFSPASQLVRILVYTVRGVPRFGSLRGAAPFFRVSYTSNGNIQSR